MADKDIVTKLFMSKNEVFADAFNYLMFNGIKVIDPSKLQECDTTEIIKNDSLYENKFRDILKILSYKTDGNTKYLLLGIENQTTIDKSMVVRCMHYDSMRYLRMFKNNETVLPIITLVVYFGANEWTAPKSLYETLDIPRACMPFISNYKMNLIEPYNMTQSDLNMLSTDLYQVLKFIKYSTAKDNGLSNAISNDLKFKAVSKDAVDVINIMTGSEFAVNEKEMKVNMCDAIKNLENFAHTKGIKEGLLEGLKEGKAEGKSEGICIMLDTLYKTNSLTSSLLDKLYYDGNITEEIYNKYIKLT